MSSTITREQIYPGTQGVLQFNMELRCTGNMPFNRRHSSFPYLEINTDVMAPSGEVFVVIFLWLSTAVFPPPYSTASTSIRIAFIFTPMNEAQNLSTPNSSRYPLYNKIFSLIVSHISPSYASYGNSVSRVTWQFNWPNGWGQKLALFWSKAPLEIIWFLWQCWRKFCKMMPPNLGELSFEKVYFLGMLIF